MNISSAFIRRPVMTILLMVDGFTGISMPSVIRAKVA